MWERLAARRHLPRWLINTVGGYRPGALADTRPDEYTGMLEFNLTGTWTSCRAAATRLGSGGAIFNVASRAALRGSAGAAAYAVSKAGVVRLTQVLADELAARRVRVNVVLPALIAAGSGAARSSPAVPAAEIAAVIAFLCSDAAGAVTGATVPVYGWA
ncbi:MAG: SDR family oxidoreductase [Actinomycetota bacterium]|nr:SDR family oxidoreductase [Actinomycetota bacterium]